MEPTSQPRKLGLEFSNTDDTRWTSLAGPFVVDAEGCTVTIGQKSYRLPVTLPNYNSLYSLLLACWLNEQEVSLKYKLLADLDPTPGAVKPQEIISIQARFAKPQ